MLTLREDWRTVLGGAVAVDLLVQIHRDNLRQEAACHLVAASLDLLVATWPRGASAPLLIETVSNATWRISRLYYTFLAEDDDTALAKCIELGRSAELTVVVLGAHGSLKRELTEASRRDLSVLVPLLNRFTLIEFKGPTDTLEPGDLAQLAGCAFLWHSQQAERVPQRDVSLIVLAPRVNEGVRDELRCLGWQISEHEAGVHCITGGPFAMWLIETDVMAELGQPVFSLVSRVFLKEHPRIIEQLTRTGHGMLLCYTLQQI